MGEYSYKGLKGAARQVRARMAEKGRHVEKRARRKPREPEKKALLFQRAMDRIKRYPPLMTEQGLILPYFRTQSGQRGERS